MGDKKKKSKGPTGYRGKFFDLRIQLFTDETYQLRDVYNDMKVKAMKSTVEFVTGIPSHLQRLTYLDEADMMDDKDLKHHDVVPGATISLDVWHTWKPLILAAARGNAREVFKLGVTQNAGYNTPNSEQMKPHVRQAWIAERAFVALCIAAHRGHVDLVEKLIQGGADVSAKTPKGRTALHIAAAQGMNNSVEVLLNHGSKIEDPDIDGKSPLVLAGLWGHKSCERQIFLFQWQQRATKQKPRTQMSGRMPHQMFDSKLKTWLEGPHAQKYYSQIVPPGEFAGTALSAPRVTRRPSSAPSDGRLSSAGSMETDGSSNAYIQLVDGKESGVQVRLGVETLKSVKFKDGKKNAKSTSKTSSKDQKATFDDWLARKKSKEKKISDEKKMVEKEKKIKQEDEEREAQHQSKSFEVWLKEQRKVKGRNSAKTPARDTPDEKSFDLWKIRKEMDILHPVHISN